MSYINFSTKFVTQQFHTYLRVVITYSLRVVVLIIRTLYTLSPQAPVQPGHHTQITRGRCCAV